MSEKIEIAFQIRRLVPYEGECEECGRDTSGYEELPGCTVHQAEQFLMLDTSQLKDERFRFGIAKHLGLNIAARIRHYLEKHPAVKEAEDDSCDQES